jgi:hypothetical protein
MIWLSKRTKGAPHFGYCGSLMKGLFGHLQEKLDRRTVLLWRRLVKREFRCDGRPGWETPMTKPATSEIPTRQRTRRSGQIHDKLRKDGGNGVIAQLDVSATPKYDKGVVFPYVDFRLCLEATWPSLR